MSALRLILASVDSEAFSPKRRYGLARSMLGLGLAKSVVRSIPWMDLAPDEAYSLAVQVAFLSELKVPRPPNEALTTDVEGAAAVSAWELATNFEAQSMRAWAKETSLLDNRNPRPFYGLVAHHIAKRPPTEWASYITQAFDDGARESRFLVAAISTLQRTGNWLSASTLLDEALETLQGHGSLWLLRAREHWHEGKRTAACDAALASTAELSVDKWYMTEQRRFVLGAGRTGAWVRLAFRQLRDVGHYAKGTARYWTAYEELTAGQADGWRERG